MNSSNLYTSLDEAKDRGALVFVNTENCVADTELYRTEKTSIIFREEDFHNISGKYALTRAAIDRVGEAAGVVFIAETCNVTTETREDEIGGKRTIFRAVAQGKTRMPDGSWRESTVDEYEFDPVLRAMLDKNVVELNDKTRPLIGRAVIEYNKVGRQRAATGVRERVVRQLTGMPAAFSKEDTKREFVFTRVVGNTSYILKTPEGRAMATAKALGVDVASLFGGRKAVPAAPPPDDGGAAYENPPPDDGGAADGRVIIPPASSVELFPAKPDGGAAGEAKKETEFDRLTAVLIKIVECYEAKLNLVASNGANPYKAAKTELDNKDATEETRRNMIERLQSFLKITGVNV